MKKGLTFLQFLKAVANYPLADLGDFMKDAEKTFSLFPERLSCARGFTGMYLTVYPLKKYVYADQNLARMVGSTIADITGNGIAEQHYHKDDAIIYNEKIFPASLVYFKSTPVIQQAGLMMSCNFRVMGQAGNMRTMLQESFFIKTAPDGMPLAALGFITDISHIRNDNRIGHCIRNANGELYNGYYYSGESGKNLTGRQIEIIRLIYAGLTTKEIAHRLNIAEKTTDNHRQNIYKITNCRNTAELIVYALKHGHITL